MVEYVSTRSELQDPGFAEFASVFGKFATAEEMLNGTAEADGGADAASAQAADGAGAAKAKGGEVDDEQEEPVLSKRRMKQMKRLSIAELKQL